MLIYGWRAVHLKSAQSATITCPNCGTKGSIINSVYSRHIHIFWIPLISTGKKGVIQCENCHFEMKVKDLPDDIKREYNILKSDTRVPIWQFSGLILIALIVIYVNFSNNLDKKNEIEYISNPLSGDVYEYETEGTNFSTIKIIDVTNDSVFFLLNEYETSMMSGIDDIEIEKNYNPDDVYVMGRSELKEMYEEGIIYDINR